MSLNKRSNLRKKRDTPCSNHGRAAALLVLFCFLCLLSCFCAPFVRAFVRACLLGSGFSCFRNRGLCFVQEMTAPQDNRKLPRPIPPTPTRGISDFRLFQHKKGRQKKKDREAAQDAARMRSTRPATPPLLAVQPAPSQHTTRPHQAPIRTRTCRHC